MAKRPRSQHTPQPAYRKPASMADIEGAPVPREKVPAIPKPPEAKDDCFKQFEKYKAEAKRRRDPWIKLWQEIYDYCLPNRESFYQVAPGQQRTDLIYDETAVQGLPRLASRLSSGYFPEYGEIFSLSPGEDAPDHMKGPEGQEKINQLTNLIHECWQSSNYFSEMAEGVIDLAVGTMNICQEEGDFPLDLRFKAVPPTHLAILPGPNGTTRGWFQWKKMALEDLRQEYPKGVFNEKMTRDLKQNPRTEVNVDLATWETSTPTERSWKHVVVVESYKQIVVERELKGEGACPWSTTRWGKTGYDVWGRGPLMNVMPAIKTCNLTVQMILENAELALGGMWVYDDDGVFNPDNIVLQPGVFIPKGQGSKVEALTSPAKFDVSQLVLGDMRMNIKKGLFIDEMDTPGKTPRSAYEVQSRIAEIARDLSAPGGRITKECLIPQINRTIYILDKQGVLESLGLRVDGRRIKLKVKSPFLRGQDAIEMNELMTTGAQVDGIFGQGTAAMIFKLPETVAYIADKNGVTPRLINSPAEIQKMIGKATQDAAAGGVIGGEGGVDPGQIAGMMQGAG